MLFFIEYTHVSLPNHITGWYLLGWGQYLPYTESRNLMRNPLVLLLQSRFDYNTAWPNKACVAGPMHNPVSHGNNSFLTLVSDFGGEPEKLKKKKKQTLI